MTSWHELFHYFIQFTPFCTEFQAVMERSQMHPNTMKHQNMRLGSNGVVRCVRCKKLQCDFVARTFALIALVHPILHQVSCSYEMIPNAPKHCETPKHEIRVQWGGSGAFVARNYNVTSWHDLFALIEPVQYVLQQVSCSYETIPNAPKYKETHRNISFGSNGVDCSLRKNPT